MKHTRSTPKELQSQSYKRSTNFTKQEQRLTSTHIQSYKVSWNRDLSEINRTSIP